MEAANRLRASIYFPARALLDWESKWHRKLLECDGPEREGLLRKARSELEAVVGMMDGTPFLQGWFSFCLHVWEVVEDQCKANMKWEDV